MTEKGMTTQNNGGAVATTPERATERARTIRPAVDILDYGEKIVLLADLPGVKQDDVSINIEDRVLTLDAKTHAGMERGAIYSEFALARYYRQFELSDLVDQDKISAELKNGVLNLHMPKAEKSKPRSVQVSVN